MTLTLLLLAQANEPTSLESEAGLGLLIMLIAAPFVLMAGLLNLAYKWVRGRTAQRPKRGGTARHVPPQ